MAILNYVFVLAVVSWHYARISNAFQGIRPPGTRSLRQQESVSFNRRDSFTITALAASTLEPPSTSNGKSASDASSESNAILAPNLSTVKEWTRTAVQHRGTPAGYHALQRLSQACQQRLPYDFSANKNTQPNVHHAPQLIPHQVTQQVSSIVKEMEAQGLLSTNLDSVDGLPSFHLNLVSNGKPLFPKQKEHPQSGQTTHNIEDAAFAKNVQKLLDLVQPYIYDQLLPQARMVGQSDQIQVSDIFLRRYGQEGDDARNGISAHYDVFSKVTSVIAMDNVAASGNNGLYTTAVNEGTDGKTTTTSNHASLRRYFPLKEGDAVIHTWNVLHGVDVVPGSDRTSLIVWFTESPKDDGNASPEGVSPWLLQDKDRLECDAVTQFVLASALASAGGHVSSEDATMYQSKPSSNPETCQKNPQALYLQSAAQGNALALSRVGSICEEEAWTNPGLERQEQQVLDELGTLSDLPAPLRMADISLSQQMSWRFWWEATVRGNPSAQFALADDLMATMSSEDAIHADCLLLATVLFGLAAQQGMEGALNRLTKVVELEVACQGIETEEEFDISAVFQTARAATTSMSQQSQSPHDFER